MNWINWPRKRRTDTVTIGGEVIEIKPLRLEPAIELVLLLSPYLPLLERKWATFQNALGASPDRPEVLSALFRALAGEMQKAPGDMVRIVALLVDRPIEWVAQNATGGDLFAAFPVFNKVNEFENVLSICQRMVRFDNGN